MLFPIYQPGCFWTRTTGSGDGGHGGGRGGTSPKKTSTKKTSTKTKTTSGLSPYIQEYQDRFMPGATPPKSLLAQAKSQKWSLGHFDEQVRLKDPSYFRSVEAKLLLPTLNNTMKLLFPQLADRTKQVQLMKTPAYRKTAVWYLRNGIGLKGSAGQDLLYGHITQSKVWEKANPYWNVYARNANVGVQRDNPVLYKQYLDALQKSFASVGVNTMSPDYYKTFFQSTYASPSGLKEFQSNLGQYAQTAGAQSWWQGQGMDPGQIKTATLDASPAGQNLRARLAQHFGVQKAFLSNQQQPFQTSMSQGGDIVQPNL